MPSKREQLLEIMEDAAKGETKATLLARIAELEAEVERLKHDGFLARVAEYFDASELAGSFMPEDGDGGFLAAIHGMTKEIARLRAEALSRTGAVKEREDHIATLKAENEQLHAQLVKATDPAYLEEKLRQIGITDEIAERALAERAGGVRFVGNIPGSSSASGFAPLTTEPAAPEGQQPADAVLASALKLAREYRPTMDKDILHSWASDAVKVIRVLSDRPSEQAVTDAIVEAVRKLFLDDVDVWLSDDTIRGALKAAMEAGRHE